jgi:drug/metabolite transporter (DMT)-like permease
VETQTTAGQRPHWQWTADGLSVFGPDIIRLMALAGAHDAGRSLIEAVLEGLFVAALYAPFFALSGVRVEPEPRWWKAALVLAIALWFGLLPAVAGWLLDYYSSLSDALIVGAIFSLFVAAIAVFGREQHAPIFPQSCRSI